MCTHAPRQPARHRGIRAFAFLGMSDLSGS
jgi:hypothetical protein